VAVSSFEGEVPNFAESALDDVGQHRSRGWGIKRASLWGDVRIPGGRKRTALWEPGKPAIGWCTKGGVFTGGILGVKEFQGGKGVDVAGGGAHGVGS